MVFYADKAAARRAILAELRGLPGEYVQAASAALRQKLVPLMQGVEHVCLYAALPHEVDLLPLLQEAPDKHYYFPRCRPGHRLSFHRVRRAEQLAPGALGIPTPGAELPELRPQQAQLIIVPGVAFTLAGKRLGYGGGYYDRFLPRCPAAATLALALPEQLYPDLPTDPHDCTLHCVLHA